MIKAERSDRSRRSLPLAIHLNPPYPFISSEGALFGSYPKQRDPMSYATVVALSGWENFYTAYKNFINLYRVRTSFYFFRRDRRKISKIFEIL